MRVMLRLAVILATGFVAASAAESTAARKPDILFIAVDDLND